MIFLHGFHLQDGITHPFRLTKCALAVCFLSACGGGGGGSTSTSSNDAPPSVSADPRIIVDAGSAVSLSADASDPDGDAISYSWTQISGSAITNTAGFSSNTASFSAPEDVDSLVLRVTATANGLSDTADVQVIVLEDTTTAIFVDAQFTGSSTGGIDAPFSDLAVVLNNLEEGQDVYIKTPSDSTRINTQESPGVQPNLQSGNSLYGGFDSNWSRDTQNNRTPIEAVELGLIYNRINVPTVVSGLDLFVSATQTNNDFNLVGIYASEGSASFAVDNNTVVLEDFDEDSLGVNGGGSYGVYLHNIDTTVISNNVITSGRAKNARNQSARTTGVGQDGNNGEDARVGLNIIGGAGGSGTGGWNGGAGGNAGNTSFEPGEGGQRGGGRSSPVVVGGGDPGSLGFDNDTSTSEGRDGGDGGNGDHGPRGTPGEGAQGYGRVSTSGVYARAIGGTGGDGWAGGGGGGGGGASAGAAGANGGAGGGGGEGGDGGAGGYGGFSGYPSIAVHVAGGNSNTISHNQITSGDGGRGGIGGTGAPGGKGGQGGLGVEGTQGPANAKGGTGGNGGNGGNGGRGGSGGSGGGGPSFAVFIGGNTPATVTNNMINTGDGGVGGAADFTDEERAAGYGGWTVGIFDGDTLDSLTPEQRDNSFNLGNGGPAGNPRITSGQSINTNF